MVATFQPEIGIGRRFRLQLSHEVSGAAKSINVVRHRQQLQGIEDDKATGVRVATRNYGFYIGLQRHPTNGANLFARWQWRRLNPP